MTQRWWSQGRKIKLSDQADTHEESAVAKLATIQFCFLCASTDAKGGFAHQAPQPRLQVGFTENAAQQLAAIEHNYSDLRQLIIEVLQYDPRPIYYRKNSTKKIFSMELYDFSFILTNLQYYLNNNTYSRAIWKI